MTATATRALLAAALCAFVLSNVTAVAAPPPAPAVSGADSNSRELLAHGTEQRYWAADVAPVARSRNGAVKTSVRYRSAGDAEWREIAEFATPAIALADRGAELLVVLSGGQWSIVSDDGNVRSGMALPGGGGVIELASDGDDVWAVGTAAKGRMIAPAASSATAASTTSTAPPLSSSSQI